MSDSKPPINVSLHDGYAAVRMKRHVNTGPYENAELEVSIPCPVDMVGSTIDSLFVTMTDFQKKAREQFSRRYAYDTLDDDEEEEDE